MRDAFAPATSITLVVGAVALGGCVPGLGVPAPVALQYGVPAVDTAVYLFADTARFTVDAGPMGPMLVTTSNTGTARLGFDPLPAGLGVAVTFPRLTSTYETAAGGTDRGTQDDLLGAIRLRIGPSGDIVVAGTPRFLPPLARIAGPESLVRPLFIRLPNRPVQAGDHWVDTVTTRESVDGTSTRATSRITTTLVGDTVVNEVELLVLRTEAENRIETTDTSGAVRLVQRVEGRTSGRAYWDPERRLLVLREEEGQLAGTLQLVGVDRDPLPVTATVSRRVELRR